MPIVISRTGEVKPKHLEVTQEQRDALWYAFVGSWLEKNQEQFQDMLHDPDPAKT